MNKNLKERLAMIDIKDKTLSITKQCELLSTTRSTYYYKSKEYSNLELLVMQLLDKVHTAIPVYGSRKLTVAINDILGEFNLPPVNRKRILKYMKILNIEAIYQKPNLSKLGKKQYIYPYLLRNVSVTRANQVWSSDITYIPYYGGFIYLYAIIDWYSRTVLAFATSNTLNNDFVIATVKEAISKYGCPEIMNSDQGSHFTSKEYIELLQFNHIKISMDGKSRALDNIFIERFWRTIKYEYIFLYDFDTPHALEKGIIEYINFYNYKRHHQALKYDYPMNIYNKELYTKNNMNVEFVQFKEFDYLKDIQKTVEKHAS